MVQSEGVRNVGVWWARNSIEFLRLLSPNLCPISTDTSRTRINDEAISSDREEVALKVE